MEVDLTGVDPLTYPHLATWEWHIAAYLFIGGLVAGIMVLGTVLRMRKAEGYDRAVRIAEVVALPLIAVGLLLLFFDLGNGWNSWRFYTTFQPTSAMSWGSWILAVVMVLLVIRIGIGFASELARWAERWGKGLGVVSRLAEWFKGRARILDWAFIVFGVSLGIYTGVLLSTIPARPLWDSFALAPLFLVSGITTGGAFLCLFLEREPHLRLVPWVISLCVAELALLGLLLATLFMGPAPSEAAGRLLFEGWAAPALWGGFVVLGILVPVTIETAEWLRRKVPEFLSGIAPYLKLVGGVVLRFVIVYAGVESVL